MSKVKSSHLLLTVSQEKDGNAIIEHFDGSKYELVKGRVRVFIEVFEDDSLGVRIEGNGLLEGASYTISCPFTET